MRSIIEGLRSYLAAHVSTGGYPVRIEAAEQDDSVDKSPYFVLHREGSENYGATDDGDGGTGLRAETIDIVAYAATNGEALGLADAVASHLSSVSPGTAMGAHRVVTDISNETDSGDFDPEQYGGEKGRSIGAARFWIQHKAA